MPLSGPDPAATPDPHRDLSLLEDGVSAARHRLDDVAARIVNLRPGVAVPDSLSDLLSEARRNLDDVEVRRDAARTLLRKSRDCTRPGIG